MPYRDPEKDECTKEDYAAIMANNVADWSPLSKKSFEERKKLAQDLGPNWACILSGLGDQ